MWQLLLDFYGYVIFFYSMTLIVSYVILMLLAQKGIFTQYDEIEESYAKHIVWNNPYTPGVSIVAPAFNEEKTIIDNVESLLMQDYPLFEVVIVNDGSRDSTLEKLITYFELEKVPFNYVEHIHTKPFKALYRSRNPKYYQLTVVDKENGGTKADPINAGLNVASYPYFINTDVDCILSPDAIFQCMLPVMSDSKIVAVSGMMTMSNGCEVDHGVITKVKPPTTPIPLFQELEYLRSFVVGKMGWSAINAMSNVSGGYGLFGRQVVMAAGGYGSDSFAEDMDMLLRIMGYCCENNIDYRVVQIPKVCCRTEGPGNIRMLNRQRTRWGRGLIQTFHYHFHMLGNHKYHRVGLITLPYVFVFEFLAPVIEAVGFFMFIYLAITNGINWEMAWLIFAAIYTFSVMLSFVVIFYTYEAKCTYTSLKSFVPLMLAALVEPFLYHPMLVFFSIKGYFNYLTGKKAVWHSIARKGYKSGDAQADGTSSPNSSNTTTDTDAGQLAGVGPIPS